MKCMWLPKVSKVIRGNSSNGFLLVRFFLMYYFVHCEKILLRIKLIIRVSEIFELFALVYHFVHGAKKLMRISLIIRVSES